MATYDISFDGLAPLALDYDLQNQLDEALRSEYQNGGESIAERINRRVSHEIDSRGGVDEHGQWPGADEWDAADIVRDVLAAK